MITSSAYAQCCRLCLYSPIVLVMARFLLPLSTEQISAYVDVDSLVDVAVHTSADTTNIVTFDPMLLPSHLKDGFLTQLFEWQKRRTYCHYQALELGKANVLSLIH